MKQIRSVAVAFLATLLSLPALAQAAPESADDLSWCETQPAALALAVARHRSQERRASRDAVEHSALPASSPNVYRYEEIAVIEADSSLIISPQAFDLAGRSLQFLRRPKGMGIARSNLGIKALVGDRLDLNDDDALQVRFPEGFEFPFFGEVHTSVYVSSNGQLTFGEPAYDAYPDAGELLFGPPRIAPLLANLNPTFDTTERAGVYVNFLNRRMRITWLELPWEVPRYGTERLVSVQVTLFDNGRIVFAYGDVAAETGIVGVFPGGLDVDFELLDLSAELPQPPRQAALFELFLDEESLDMPALTKTFFRYFEDRYDQLILWFEPQTEGGREAITISNDVLGIGYPIGDVSDLLGSKRLSSIAVMGSLADYPDDPREATAGTYSTMGVLAHEVGHRWLGALRFMDDDDRASLDLMSSELAHWSFYVDTDGSYMGGADIQELESGVFETVDATARYSKMDQYLMGLIPPEEVPSFFYVDATEGPGRDASPQVGVTLRGERVDVSVGDVIAAEGPRVPSVADSPKVFNMAFVLLARQGEPPPLDSLAKLDSFRRFWHRTFREATDGYGRVNTALREK